MNEEINQSVFTVGQKYFGNNGKEVYPEQTNGDLGYGNDNNVNYIMYVEAMELE